MGRAAGEALGRLPRLLPAPMEVSASDAAAERDGGWLWWWPLPLLLPPAVVAVLEAVAARVRASPGAHASRQAWMHPLLVLLLHSPHDGAAAGGLERDPPAPSVMRSSCGEG